MKPKQLFFIALSAAVVAGWFFRFEPLGESGDRRLLLNRWTGEVVSVGPRGRNGIFAGASGIFKGPYKPPQPAEAPAASYDAKNTSRMFDEFEPTAHRALTLDDVHIKQPDR